MNADVGAALGGVTTSTIFRCTAIAHKRGEPTLPKTQEFGENPTRPPNAKYVVGATERHQADRATRVSAMVRKADKTNMISGRGNDYRIEISQ